MAYSVDPEQTAPFSSRSSLIWAYHSGNLGSDPVGVSLNVLGVLYLLNSGLDSDQTQLDTYSNDPKFSDGQVMAYSADPDQTAPRGAVWSASTLFAILSISFVRMAP